MDYRKVQKATIIAFAFVATHNHFVLDRGGKVFKQSAPVIKLPEGASEDDHLALLGLLNSAIACFWMQQVFHNKGRPGADAQQQMNRGNLDLSMMAPNSSNFPCLRNGL